jgi:hypothetical protein
VTAVLSSGNSRTAIHFLYAWPHGSGGFHCGWAAAPNLYCGNLGTGNFILSVRTWDANLQNTVIRASSLGDKLTSADIDSLTHKYAIDRIVVPEPATRKSVIRYVTSCPPPWFKTRRSPLDHPKRGSTAKIKIYQFTNPAANPEKQLKIRVRKLQKDFYVELDD